MATNQPPWAAILPPAYPPGTFACGDDVGGYYVVPLPFDDGDLGGSEAVELVDEGVDGVIGGGDVARDQLLAALK